MKNTRALIGGVITAIIFGSIALLLSRSGSNAITTHELVKLLCLGIGLIITLNIIKSKLSIESFSLAQLSNSAGKFIIGTIVTLVAFAIVANSAFNVALAPNMLANMDFGLPLKLTLMALQVVIYCVFIALAYYQFTKKPSKRRALNAKQNEVNKTH